MLYLLVSLFLRQRVLSVFVGGELLIKLLLRIFPSYVLLRSELGRYREERHDRVVVDAVHLHFVENLQRVGHRLRHIREHLVHLGPRFEPLLLSV